MKAVSKKGKFEIDIDHYLCGICGACVAVCPENALYLGTDLLKSDDEGCTGCNYCIITCPSDALALKKYIERDNE